MSEVPTYSERIHKRLRVWWQKPRDLRDPNTYTDYLHQLRERSSSRRRDDSEESWRCCPHWQRSLSNKWNAREFAVRNGCQVPELYWYGRNLRDLRFESLPDRYVIRPTFGHSREGVYVFCDGLDLLTARSIGRAEVCHTLGGVLRRLLNGRVLVEEFVSDPASKCRLPLECDLHMFGERIGAIQVIHRSAVKGRTRHRWYSDSWQPFSDQMNPKLPLADPIPAPSRLAELIRAGQRLGRAYGTYVRVDFLVTETKVVFGEFATTPGGGRGFTPFADQYLGGLWQGAFPGET